MCAPGALRKPEDCLPCRIPVLAVGKQLRYLGGQEHACRGADPSPAAARIRGIVPSPPGTPGRATRPESAGGPNGGFPEPAAPPARGPRLQPAVVPECSGKSRRRCQASKVAGVTILCSRSRLGSGMASTVADVPPPVLADLYLRCGAVPAPPPSKTTIGRVLTDAGTGELDAAARTWLMELAGLACPATAGQDAGEEDDPPALTQVRLDGKAVRGARNRRYCIWVAPGGAAMRISYV
jgi:hypothetical protein